MQIGSCPCIPAPMSLLLSLNLGAVRRCPWRGRQRRRLHYARPRSAMPMTGGLGTKPASHVGLDGEFQRSCGVQPGLKGCVKTLWPPVLLSYLIVNLILLAFVTSANVCQGLVTIHQHPPVHSNPVVVLIVILLHSCINLDLHLRSAPCESTRQGVLTKHVASKASTEGIRRACNHSASNDVKPMSHQEFHKARLVQAADGGYLGFLLYCRVC